MERLLILAVALVSPGAAAFLYFVEPTASGWYPKCIFHWVTGFYCPFCGTTRCGHAMLNGNLSQAAAWNMMSVVLLPAATLWLYWATLCIVRKQPLPRLDPPAWLLKVFMVVVFAFWLARNLPLFPFELLAPHRL